MNIAAIVKAAQLAAGGSAPKPAEISKFPVLLSVPVSSDRFGAVRCHGQVRFRRCHLVLTLYQNEEWFVPDDTLPGGPRPVSRTYQLPFARVSREDDYRVAWAFSEKPQLK